MVTKKDWRQVAENLLKNEAEKAKLNFPPPEGIILQWRGKYYFGSLQEVASEFSKEVVLLSKTSRPIPEELVEAISEIQPKRTWIIVDEYLDLEGRTHLLRRVGSRLTKCTPEQTKYMLNHPPTVFEEGIQLKIDFEDYK